MVIIAEGGNKLCLRHDPSIQVVVGNKFYLIGFLCFLWFYWFYWLTIDGAGILEWGNIGRWFYTLNNILSIAMCKFLNNLQSFPI